MPKAAAGKALLSRLELNTLQAVLPEHHFVELVYVLSSPRLYHLDRTQVAGLLLPLLDLPGLRLESGARLKHALQLFTAHPSVDFPDCLTGALALASDDTVLSYDRDFDRLGVRRQEPES